MKTKRNILYLIMAAICLLMTETASAQNQVALPLSSPGEPGKLELGLIRGSVSITGYDGDEVIINYGGEDIEDEEREVTRDGLRRISGNGIGFEAIENDNRVEIGGISPMRKINFDIMLPRNFSLQLSLVHGEELKVENLNGELEISHVNGDVNLNNVGGSATVNTVNGNITASFSMVAPDKPMAFSNVNGDIDVTFPSEANISAKMKSDWGEVFTDFDMEVKRNGQEKMNNSETGFFKISINNWIFGEINGGGPEYLFKSMRGDIYIRKN